MRKEKTILNPKILNERILFLGVIFLGIIFIFFADFAKADCTENDGGINLSVRGTNTGPVGSLTGTVETKSDTCDTATSPQRIEEWYCDSADVLRHTYRDCSGYCASGRCVECTASSHCNDGNSCTTDTCSSNNCTHLDVTNGTSCGTGKVCYSGTCTNECTENDGGNRPYYSGYTIFDGDNSYDNCSSATVLREYYCSGGLRQVNSFDCSSTPTAYCDTNRCVLPEPECTLATDCADQVCKIKNCSAGACVYSNDVDGTICGPDKKCQGGACLDVPTCVAFNKTIDSSQSTDCYVSSAGTDKWSAVCEDFDCSGFICNFSSTDFSKSSNGNIIDGTFGASLTFYNSDTIARRRTCDFTVWNSATPGLTGTCTGIVEVGPGGGDPPPATCSAYDHTVNSGDTQLLTVSSAGTNTWEATCTNFECDSNSCTYEAGHTQDYSGEQTGNLVANIQFFNESSSNKTRTCSYTFWNSADKDNTLKTCTGTVTVRPSSAPPIVPECTGYDHTIDSGESVTTAVSASGYNTWSAECTKFRCDDYSCDYRSSDYKQYYGPYNYSKTLIAQMEFFNNSGIDQTRRCTFRVWNSADTSAVGTCTGSVTVRAIGGGDDSPPQLSLSASPTSITLGESTRLRWEVDNADSCTASGDWSGTKDSDDGIYYQYNTPSSTGTKTYRLACSNGGGTSTRTVTVDVSPIIIGNNSPTAQITAPLGNETVPLYSFINFTGNGSDADPGDTIAGFEWHLGGCGDLNSLLLATGSSVPDTLSMSFPVAGIYEIYFRVMDSHGAWSTCDSRMVTVTEGAVSPTVSLVAPPNATVNNPFSLNWELINFDGSNYTPARCVASMTGDDGDNSWNSGLSFNDFSGAHSITPKRTELVTYTLTCSSTASFEPSITGSANVNITDSTPPPPPLTIYNCLPASCSTLGAGTYDTYCWDITNSIQQPDDSNCVGGCSAITCGGDNDGWEEVAP